MPRVDDMMPSKYLKASDCADEDGDPIDLLLTISHVDQESVGMGAQAEDKWVLYFNERDKGLVLNKTNIKAIAAIHGDDTDEWEGKRIALYQTEVEYQGNTMMGIRVRLKAPAGRKKPSTATVTAPAADGDNDPADASDIPF